MAPPPPDEKHEMGKRLATTAKQSGQVFLIKILMFGAAFISNFVIARLFGVAVVGEFALMLSIVSIAIIFSVFGLSMAMVKYVPIARASDVDGEENHVAYIALSASLAFACLCALVLFALSDVLANHVFHIPELRDLLRVGAVGLIPLTLSKVMGGVYKGARAASAYSMIFEFIDKLLLLVFIVTVALLDLRLSLFVALAWMLNQLITLTILVVRARRFNLDIGAGRRLARVHPGQNRTHRRKLFGFASTMILVAAMSFMLGRVDLIMIGLFLDASDVGVYKIALVIAGLTGFMMASTNMIFPTFISELYATGKKEQLRAIYATVTKWVIVLAAPLVLSMLLYPKPILGFFGEEYVGGSSVLMILAAAFFIRVIVGSNGFMLSMTGRERVVLANNVAVAALNIGLNLLLIPRLGITGAAVATAISIASINLIKVLEVKVLMGIMPYDRTYVPVLLGIAVIVLIAWLLRPLVVNAFVVAAVTALNVAVVVGIAYRFRTENDDLIFSRIAGRLGRGRAR